MAKFGGNNRRVQRGGAGRGPRPQGGFKRRGDGGNGPIRRNFGGAGNQQGERRRGGSGFRRGGGAFENRRGSRNERRGGRFGGRGGRGGKKPVDHSALDEDMLQYWDKAGVKDKRDEEKALQKAKLDRELEEYKNTHAAAASGDAAAAK